MSYDIVVVGGANTDYLIRAEHLPGPGESIEGDTFLQATGGKGANQAIAAARLGAQVAFVGCVGADERGTQLLDQLAAHGVNVDHVVRGTDPTGAVLVMVDTAGQKQTMALPGANRQLTVEHVHAIAPVLHSAQCVLMQLEILPVCVHAAAAIARAAGVRVIVDPAPPQSIDATLYPLIDIIKPNTHEASSITGIAVHDVATARQAAGWFIERGVGAALVQAASAGTLLLWRDGADLREDLLPRLPVFSIDSTGAGDAFAAALAVATLEAQPLLTAARFANAAAAIATTRIGAQAGLPTRADVAALQLAIDRV